MLVSEVMLSQTQVARVVGPFTRFVERFPTPGACAAAPEGDVLRLWSGLGYNRRAIQLHRCAVQLVERHGATVPRETSALLALPGIGPYIARAVASFAFGAPVGVVDTNVGRVLARAFAGRALSAPEAQLLADSLLPAGRARDWNLAVMDFGSVVCRAKAPFCDRCPLGASASCVWRASGNAEDPARRSASWSARQAPFPGSDREARGRLVEAARRGPVRPGMIAAAAGLPEAPDRARRLALALVAEGMLVMTPDDGLALP